MSTRPRRHSGVRQRRFSKAEYYQLGELGLFNGQRVELIEGRLMVHSPQNALHASAIYETMIALQQAFGPAYLVRCQLSLDLGPTSEPEPDLAVVGGPASLYRQAHPTTAVLVVEVSDTSLTHDRRKGGLYARAGIAEYWIVNLVHRQIEMYRLPIADVNEPFGHIYASRSDSQVGGTVSPLALPSASLAVAQMIP